MDIFTKAKKDFPSSGSNTYFVDLDTGERLGLQGLPNTISMDPKSTWATIRPFGKNNPNYHFTGSEDILEIEISWFVTEETRTDVLERCKWLESATKSDGKVGRPHIFRFMFGELYQKAAWIIQQAPYELSNFDPDNGMKPKTAIQKVTLARFERRNSTLPLIIDWKY